MSNESLRLKIIENIVHHTHIDPRIDNKAREQANKEYSKELLIKKSRIEERTENLSKIKELIKKLKKGETDAALFNFVNNALMKGTLSGEIGKAVERLEKAKDLGTKARSKEIELLNKEYKELKKGKLDYLRFKTKEFMKGLPETYKKAEIYSKLIKELFEQLKKEKEDVIFYFLGIDMRKEPGYGVLLYKPESKLGNAKIHLSEVFGVCPINAWKVLVRKDDEIIKHKFNELKKRYKGINLGFGKAVGLNFKILKKEHYAFMKQLSEELKKKGIIDPHEKQIDALREWGPAITRTFLKEYVVKKWLENDLAGIEYDKIKGFL